MDVGGQIHAPAALQSGKVPRYPLKRRLEGGSAEPNLAFKKKRDMACSCGLKLQKLKQSDGGNAN